MPYQREYRHGTRLYKGGVKKKNTEVQTEYLPRPNARVKKKEGVREVKTKGPRTHASIQKQTNKKGGHHRKERKKLISQKDTYNQNP